MSWALIAVAGVGAGGAIGSSLISNSGTKKRAKRDTKNIGKLADQTLTNLSGYTEDERERVEGGLDKISSLSDVFGKEANRNYLATTEGKSFTSMIEENQRKGLSNLNNSASQLNLTPEAYLAGLGQLNQKEGSSMRDLVAGSDQRKNQLRGMQLSSLGQYLAGSNALLGNKTGMAGTAYGHASNVYGRSQATQQQQGAANSQSFANMMNLLMQSQAPGTGGGGTSSGGSFAPTSSQQFLLNWTP